MCAAEAQMSRTLSETSDNSVGKPSAASRFRQVRHASGTPPSAPSSWHREWKLWPWVIVPVASQLPASPSSFPDFSLRVFSLEQVQSSIYPSWSPASPSQYSEDPLHTGLRMIVYWAWSPLLEVGGLSPTHTHEFPWHTVM